MLSTGFLSPPAIFQDMKPLQDVTNSFCSPSHAYLKLPSGHSVTLAGLLFPSLFLHFLLFWLLAWLVHCSYFSGGEEASSPNIRPDLSPLLAVALLQVVLRALPGSIMQWVGHGVVLAGTGVSWHTWNQWLAWR